MITYTFIIGYGYVEDSRGTHAIVNYYTEEQDNAKAVVEFLKTLRRCLGSNFEVQCFLDNFFNFTADGIGGSLGDLELCNNINLWGFPQEGPLIRLEGLNHFFADPDEDFGRHIECCSFEEFGDMDFVTAGSEELNVEQIYEEAFKDVKEPEVEVPSRTFTDDAVIHYQIWRISNHNGHCYEVRIINPDGSTFRLDKTFSTDTDKYDIHEWMTTNIALKSIFSKRDE
jgi:hypothetical protein